MNLFVSLLLLCIFINCRLWNLSSLNCRLCILYQSSLSLLAFWFLDLLLSNYWSRNFVFKIILGLFFFRLIILFISLDFLFVILRQYFLWISCDFDLSSGVILSQYFILLRLCFLLQVFYRDFSLLLFLRNFYRLWFNLILSLYGLR